MLCKAPHVHHYLTAMRPDGSGRDLHSAGNSCGQAYTNPRRIDLARPVSPHSRSTTHGGALRIFNRSDPPPPYHADGTGRDTFLAPVSAKAATREAAEMSVRHFHVRRVEQASLRDVLLDARQYGVGRQGGARRGYSPSAPLSPGARAAQGRSIVRLSSPKRSATRLKFSGGGKGQTGGFTSFAGRSKGETLAC
jgi:hypothetical protein